MNLVGKGPEGHFEGVTISTSHRPLNPHFDCPQSPDPWFLPIGGVGITATMGRQRIPRFPRKSHSPVPSTQPCPPSLQVVDKRPPTPPPKPPPPTFGGGERRGGPTAAAGVSMWGRVRGMVAPRVEGRSPGRTGRGPVALPTPRGGATGPRGWKGKAKKKGGRLKIPETAWAKIPGDQAGGIPGAFLATVCVCRLSRFLLEARVWINLEELFQTCHHPPSPNGVSKDEMPWVCNETIDGGESHKSGVENRKLTY